MTKGYAHIDYGDGNPSRVGVLKDGEQLWGYLLVRPGSFDRYSGFPRRKTTERALVIEMYRITPPKPDDVDWADGLGWSDTIVDGDELEPEEARLERNELLLTGRTLAIEWLDDRAADVARRRYFADGRKSGVRPPR